MNRLSYANRFGPGDGTLYPHKTARSQPEGALSEEERKRVLEIADSLEYPSKPPAQIVATLANKGEWVASELTFYRILHEKKQQHNRGKAKSPNRKTPTSHAATVPNWIWTWDIRYMASPIRGKYYYLYMIVDIFSRFFVGWEIHEEENAQYAKMLVRKAYLKEAIWKNEKPPMLHSDNGSPMKASTFRATLERLGITGSYSPPESQRRQPVLGVVLPDAQILVRIPDLRIREPGSVEIMDIRLRPVVQGDPPPQHIEIRHARTASPGRIGRRDP